MADLQTELSPTPMIVLLPKDYSKYESDKYLNCHTGKAITDYWKDYNIYFERLR